MNVVSPPYTTPGPTVTPPAGSHDYMFVIAVLLLITITYASCRCKDSRSPPPLATIYDDDDSVTITFSQGGLDDEILLTFPMLVYSGPTTPAQMFDTATDANSSTCSICLEDYKQGDVVRLLPECRHLFHVRCIDTWLNANSTCPVCRRSFAGIMR